ncbi:hypothetical protein [Halorubrum sp. Atlit-26R]|nr:hypothetical protein [Halorubrum sp. Atlit-26R]
MGGDGIVSDERICVLYVDDDQGLLDDRVKFGVIVVDGEGFEPVLSCL